MMDVDDLDAPVLVEKKLDLTQMSIHELKDRIVFLESEIGRARDMIKSKESHKAGIEGLFKI